MARLPTILVAVFAVVSLAAVGTLAEEVIVETCPCVEAPVSPNSVGKCLDETQEAGLCTFRPCKRSGATTKYVCDENGEMECVIDTKKRLECVENVRYTNECSCKNEYFMIVKPATP